MVETAVFDLDGTVLDTLNDIHESLMETLELNGRPTFDIDVTAGYVGNGLPKLLERAVGKEYYTEELLEHFRDVYNRRMVETTTYYSGVEEMLSVLKSMGIRLIVLSNKARIFTDGIITGLGADRYFDAWYGGDSFPEKKPSPLPLQVIMRRFASPIEKTVIIGDNYTDIESGHAAGVKTCFCEYGYGKLASVEPDYRASKPSDITLFVRDL
ncbi:HAD family hydrolase [Limisalsivibrio acetivorans]|uniref:HAD family hydrolase n=1 Tax=Limisalsivibrio acetivorans TaxID=1304888 RepID=UPI0003B622E1|nr:HAD hydrolase-like protein [Limisalsivibrio acetivorans]